MEVKLLHQEAMKYSFKAKQALNEDKYDYALELYFKAAELEGRVAKFYFDKPDLEPTRSIVIRSAAYLNLKAGFIEQAQEFIFFGLLNLENSQVKKELRDALEISISLQNLPSKEAGKQYSYLNSLRQKSIQYIIEPAKTSFGESVSLEMLKEFSTNFMKSFRAYASITFTRSLKSFSEGAEKEFEKLVDPLITNSSYGSFRFSLATDFLKRVGEDEKVVQLKKSVLEKYHSNIFTNNLGDDDIKEFRKRYSQEEVKAIFQPLTRIKSRNSSYKVGYINKENQQKYYLPGISSSQKKKLLPITPISSNDIGQLESMLYHTRESDSGKKTKTTIFSEELKSYEFDQLVKEIQPKNFPPILLTEEIILNVVFNSSTGFELMFPDFDLQIIDTEYQRGLDKINLLLHKKIITLAKAEDRNDTEQADWDFIKEIIADPESLKE